MVRKLRMEYAGAIYHLMNRGDWRETTMTPAWIAARRRMGAETHLAHLLYWKGQNEK